MSWVRGTLLAGALLYIALWILVLSSRSAHALIPFLATPLVLVLLLGGLNWLSSYIGLPSRPPKFEKPRDKEES